MDASGFLYGWIGIVLLMLGWMFYMMTCRPDVWLRLVKDEEERKVRREELKAKRDKRMSAAVSVGLGIAKQFLKK